MSAKEAAEAKAKREKEQEQKEAETSGRIWFLDEDGRIRTAREGEHGLTYEEARRALQDFYGEQSPVMINEENGSYIPNPKSKITQQFPHIAALTAREMNRLTAGGQETDPMDVTIEWMAKIQALKDAMGGGMVSTQQKSDVQELISSLKELDELRDRKGASESIRDLVGSLRDLDEMRGKDEGLKDMASAIARLAETIKERPQEPEELKELRNMVDNLRQQLQDEREKQYLGMIQGLKDELGSLRGELQRARQDTSARSEYDIMAQVLATVDKRAAALEDIAAGFVSTLRGEAREAIGSTIEQVRKRSVVERGQIDNIADELFFGGGMSK